MSVLAPALPRLDIDAFLAFAERREGKWELYDGVPVAMSPERIRHFSVKGRAFIALDQAIRRAGLSCSALTDGATVRIREDRAFVPDALVVCPPPPPDAIVIDNPVIVVEALSPATAGVDDGIKVEGYFSLRTLAHYLILDPDRRVVIHHARGEAGVILTRFLHEGALRLDPPGLDLQVADLFGPADPALP
jgi:Uma2 family endonuclease